MPLQALLIVAIVLSVAGLSAAEDNPGGSTRPGVVQVPAGEETAAAALKSSPRHGEWTDIPLPAGTGGSSDAASKLRTWVVYPERKDKAPVVLVIHEIFGLTDWVRAVADQLAAEGFIAVAPDMLSGKGPGGGGTESFPGDQVRDAIRKLSAEEVAQRLDAARAYAHGRPAAAERTGSIGFCWGGSMSFEYATRQPGLNAAVVYYGSAPTARESLAKIAAPVMGFYGGDDARVTSTVEPTAAAMKELQKQFSPHVYAGAGHGFLRQQTGRDGANLKAAQQARADTLAFLRKNLESGADAAKK